MTRLLAYLQVTEQCVFVPNNDLNQTGQAHYLHKDNFGPYVSSQCTVRLLIED